MGVGRGGETETERQRARYSCTRQKALDANSHTSAPNHSASRDT